LGYPDSEDFKYFYPTAVLETGWEIIRFWVSRMIMFGIYLTGKPPFKDVYLHGLVFAEDGRKMSKSLGNQVDPLNMVEEYGADVLRMGLITGTANGKDFAFPRDRVIAYRNFANKIWNMARFMNIMVDRYEGEVPEFSPELKEKLTDEDRIILSGLDALIANVDDSIEKYRFADASEQLYHFIWNEIADKYIEQVKDREDKDVALSVLEQVFSASLKLLHPFMPFVTEEIWSYLPGEQEKPLIISEWPETLK
jgi:valyl-tRNA synthetase